MKNQHSQGCSAQNNSIHKAALHEKNSIYEAEKPKHTSTTSEGLTHRIVCSVLVMQIHTAHVVVGKDWLGMSFIAHLPTMPVSVHFF